MSIIEFRGGAITKRYLMKKSKDDLAYMYLDLLRVYEQMQQRAEAAEKAIREMNGRRCPECGAVMVDWGD